MNLLKDISLSSGRVHELSGFSAVPVAMLLAQGETLICGSPDLVRSLHPDGVADFTKTQSLLHVPCNIKADALWVAETAMRSGTVDTVILSTFQTPGLTDLRRLQLAAEAGKTLGLLLVTSPARNSAAETRWYCVPLQAVAPHTLAIHISLYKNKCGNLGSWTLHAQRHKDTFTMDAAPAGEPLRPDRVAG